MLIVLSMVMQVEWEIVVLPLVANSVWATPSSAWIKFLTLHGESNSKRAKTKTGRKLDIIFMIFSFKLQIYTKKRRKMAVFTSKSD